MSTVFIYKTRRPTRAESPNEPARGKVAPALGGSAAERRRATRFSGDSPAQPISTVFFSRRAPAAAGGPVDGRAVVGHLAALAPGQEQRRVEVAERTQLGDQEGRRDSQRRAVRAADHQPEL